MFCRMTPYIEDSVITLPDDRWLIGSFVVCETDLVVPWEDIRASWTDDSGKRYYLRDQRSATPQPTERAVDQSSEAYRVHFCGTSAALWSFGDVYIKAKSWREGMPMESDTIRYVRDNTSIPVPEVICSWIDPEWNRTFTVLKAVKGKTLYEAWDDLLEDQKVKLADLVASFCKTAAALTSDKLESIGGMGVSEAYLMVAPPRHEPSWRLNLLESLTLDQLKQYLDNDPLTEALSAPFRFYHSDLGPTNIMVNEHGELVAIIDWESAAFYPSFWIGTKPLVSAGFYLRRGVDDRLAWGKLLSNALERQGFPPDLQLYKQWKSLIDKKRPD